MANSERIGVVARPTYPSWKRVLTCSNSGGGGERKKTADSASVADHQDWNRSGGSKKWARATRTAIGDRTRNCIISSNDDILETENDIGTKQTGIRSFSLFASNLNFTP